MLPTEMLILTLPTIHPASIHDEGSLLSAEPTHKVYNSTMW
jgi:hypothetical protein